MTIQTFIFGFLAADAGVAAIVGTRVYESIVPQNVTYPAISYSVISGTREAASLDGPDGQVTNSIQINCWATTGVVRAALGDAVRLALDGRKLTFGSKEIQESWLESELNRDEPSPGNEGQRLYGRILDFEITHVETARAL